MSRLTPAVSYLRMSTDRQEASIPDQREAVAKLARDHGYAIVREYKDEGISGDDTERRAGFLGMLDDAKRLGDFRAVLCWDQDRFGRFDPMDAGFWARLCRFAAASAGLLATDAVTASARSAASDLGAMGVPPDRTA